MKLTILSQYFFPEAGAPQNRLLELARIFRRNGWEVMIITAMPNYPKGKIFKEYAGRFKMNETIDGIRILRYWLYASNSSRSIPRIFSMTTFSLSCLFCIPEVKKFDPDYIFVESPPLILGYSAYVLSKMCGAKFIMNVSDIWPLTAKELGVINDGFAYRKLEGMEKFLYKKSILNTGQSEEIVTHIRNSGGTNAYLFRNGVDVNRFRNLKPKRVNSGRLKVIYAGLLGVAQGLFEIASNVDFRELNAELHIFGDGPQRFKLEEFAGKEGNRNVYLHTAVERDKIPELLSEYDSALIPLTTRIYGAVPSKIYEAMAAGLPILFSGDGEGADLVRNSGAGLVSPSGDYEQLKTNIILLSNNKFMRNEMSEKGQQAAEKYFDRNKIIDDFSNKLAELKS